MESIVTKLQTPPTLAKKEGVSAETIRNWCEKGLIKGAKVLGKSWLIPQPAVIKYPTQGRPWPKVEKYPTPPTGEQTSPKKVEACKNPKCCDGWVCIGHGYPMECPDCKGTGEQTKKGGE